MLSADFPHSRHGGIDELPQPTDGTLVDVSGERLDLFDAHVLIWLVENERQREEIRANPLYAGLDAAAQGRDVFLSSGTDSIGAMFFATVLSLPFALDTLVPVLAADGDPATEATP